MSPRKPAMFGSRDPARTGAILPIGELPTVRKKNKAMRDANGDRWGERRGGGERFPSWMAKNAKIGAFLYVVNHLLGFAVKAC